MQQSNLIFAGHRNLHNDILDILDNPDNLDNLDHLDTLERNGSISVWDLRLHSKAPFRLNVDSKWHFVRRLPKTSSIS